MEDSIMATAWEVRGEYMETCSCDYLCPCAPSNLAAPPSKGHCVGALAFQIDRGRHGDVRLDGLGFAILFRTPGKMADGNWAIGVVVDERASAAQRDAIVGIATGQAGGPMAGLGPLVTQMLGVESRPIRFTSDGLRRAVEIPGGVLDQALEGTPSPVREGEPLYIDNTMHPANARLALARATRSHMHLFGLDWDDPSGRNNGHFAPFSWRAA
jgi:hypothetical protein